MSFRLVMQSMGEEAFRQKMEELQKNSCQSMVSHCEKYPEIKSSNLQSIESFVETIVAEVGITNEIRDIYENPDNIIAQLKTKLESSQHCEDLAKQNILLENKLETYTENLPEFSES